MGLETAALVMAGISAASEVGKAVAETQAAKSEEQAIDLQSKEQKLAIEQKSLTNYDQAEKVLAAQIAHQTLTGTTLDSPSFNAIQRETFNITSRKQRNIDIEGDIEEENAAIEKKNVQSKLYATLFGDATNTAFNATSIYAKAPKGA